MTMNQRPMKMSENNDNFSHPPHSFIGQKLPLVGTTSPGATPLIGKKLPLVANKGIRGFTLMELMITLVVAAILGAVAVPNIRTFIQNARITSQSNDLLADLAYAHDEAQNKRKNVVICRSINATAAVPACNIIGAAAWENGWIVFVDNPTAANVYNNTYLVADGDLLLRVHGPLNGNITLRPNVADLNDRITYAAITGFTTLDPIAAGTAPYNFKLCDERGTTQARVIVLSQVKSPSVLRGPSFQQSDVTGVVTTFPMTCP
jgi:prepilin-type N-terminal cleavage/methylation domain-containing protein